MPEKVQAAPAFAQSQHTRAASISRLSGEVHDIVVIGGGIAGACAAWDAALRGLRVALIERADFGGATSAQSLKVLHGGIRYLQHLDIARLRESCAERAAFLRMAPHLTRPMPFALPTYGFGLRGKVPLHVAFQMLNAFTAGRNRGTENQTQHIPAPYVMSRRDFLLRFPAFDGPGLTGAGVFFDGQILNPPRLVYSIVRSAVENGAVAANYCAAERLLVQHGRVVGVAVRDAAGSAMFDVRARIVANLTGPFAPMLHERALGGPRINVPLSRDMALVVNRKILPGMGVGIQTRYRDPDAWLSRGNRHLFLAPWRDYTLIGVNSRVYVGDPNDLVVTESEVGGFIDEINEACPALGIERNDIAVVNAGLLPFGENQPGQRNLSFGKRSVLIDHAERGGPEGLVTGMSVRWTMGRLLGEQTIDLATRKLGIVAGPSRTGTATVHGGDFENREQLVESIRKHPSLGLPNDTVVHLADTFGTLARHVLALGTETALLPDGKTLAAEIRYVVRNEMAVTLADVVLRRLDLGTGCNVSAEMIEACARVAGAELGWDAARQHVEIARVRNSYPFATPASQQWRVPVPAVPAVPVAPVVK